MKGIDISTKILTDEGWKGYDEIDENARMAIVSLHSEKIMYEKISGMTRGEYEGEVYSINNRWNEHLIPPETAIIVKYIRCGTGGVKFLADEWESVKMGDVTPHGGFQIMNSAVYDGEYSIGDMQAMVIGWIISLGFKDYEGVIEIHQSMELTNEDFEIFIESLKGSDVEYDYSTNERMTILDDATFTEQIIKIPRNDKNQWIYNAFTEDFKPKYFLLHLHHNELEMLYEGMNISNNAYFDTNSIYYLNNDVEIQEFYRLLCLHLGFITHYVKKRRAYSALTTKVEERNYSNVFHVNYNDVVKEIEDYKGVFWYPKITHRHFVVKKDEKMFIVGV